MRSGEDASIPSAASTATIVWAATSLCVPSKAPEVGYHATGPSPVAAAAPALPQLLQTLGAFCQRTTAAYAHRAGITRRQGCRLSCLPMFAAQLPCPRTGLCSPPVPPIRPPRWPSWFDSLIAPAWEIALTLVLGVVALALLRRFIARSVRQLVDGAPAVRRQAGRLLARGLRQTAGSRREPARGGGARSGRTMARR